MKRNWRLTVLLLAIHLTGCSSWQQMAERNHLQQQVMRGDIFLHRLLWNPAAQQASTDDHHKPRLWHVYIEGDGHAVDIFGRPSADPTPARPLLLAALPADPYPALFLGRPCYFVTQDPACGPERWTLERYSAATVVSLQAAARKRIPPQDRVILIGHSGGGTLAMLLAARWSQTCALVTLAGNLDVGRWLAANAFTPLPDSLDPARLPPLPASISQWHFAGADDKVILPRWIETASARQPDARFRQLADTGHVSPWQSHLLDSLDALAANRNDPAAPLLDALRQAAEDCGKVTPLAHTGVPAWAYNESNHR